MSLSIECPGNVLTDPISGAALCQDGSGAPLAWTQVPQFDVSQLDPSTLTAYFTWGWFVVALGWITGKGVAIFVQFVKRV